MIEVDPWVNRIDPGAFEYLPTLPLDSDPIQKVFVGGRDDLAVAGACSVYFAGTDVTGPLHLGHLYCFAAAGSVAESRGGRFTVSINEIESGLSREVPAKDAHRNAVAIERMLRQSGIKVHSRLHDAELIYASCCLFGWLLRKRHEIVEEVYGDIRQSDLLSICPMVLTPAFLSRKSGSSVCAIYGYDEVKHVEFIYRLYRDEIFKRWADLNLVVCLPTFTYILAPLVAARDPRFKMSKSRPHDAVAWHSIPDRHTANSGMFSRLDDFAKRHAPLIAASPLGAAVARHAGGNHALL
ncbi:hypothetical protein EDC02_7624 [Micromonospora sp. Llam0]|uniref:hypothetical protein n=1 Tax=Micromonospora sp. Llam0 TaxID=2485143 RepID=UPI000F9656B3|nr:hypothetical protein [Micromonospora sp. Llam0]ROO52684.1 hypothetical protein EDC02_7624 [Micromonospora sp. Llam0]